LIRLSVKAPEKHSAVGDSAKIIRLWYSGFPYRIDRFLKMNGHSMCTSEMRIGIKSVAHPVVPLSLCDKNTVGLYSIQRVAFCDCDISSCIHSALLSVNSSHIFLTRHCYHLRTIAESCQRSRFPRSQQVFSCSSWADLTHSNATMYVLKLWTVCHSCT